MKGLRLLILCSFFFNSMITVSQTVNQNNVYKYNSSNYGRYYGVKDVWGVKINNINYALVPIDEGFSIINTSNPSNPIEIAHINQMNYNPNDPQTDRLGIFDVETFIKNGITYAYLATNNSAMPLVLIININAAISTGGTILIDPDGTPNPNTAFAGKILPNAQIHNRILLQ